MKKYVFIPAILLLLFFHISAQTPEYITVNIDGEPITVLATIQHEIVYDERGYGETYSKYYNKFNSSTEEYWYEYDEKGNCITKRSSLEQQDTYEYIYDDAGRVLSCTSKIDTSTYEYDSNGNCIKYESPYIVSYIEYDTDNNLIHEITTVFGMKSEHWIEYNPDGKVLLKNTVLSSGNISTTEYTYDDKGQLIYKKETDTWPDKPERTYETWYEYDDEGYAIYKKYIDSYFSTVVENWYVDNKLQQSLYDLCFHNGIKYSEEWTQYDMYNNWTYTKTIRYNSSNGLPERESISYSIYEYWDNGNLKSQKINDPA
ncbi:MAG: hypothetical protein KBT02_08185 [Treponema sp.]|nr:hypothetical protein [Candidatus Treponema caballi]